MNIFKFEFKRLLKSGIIWSLVCGFLIILFISLFPAMEDMGMKELVNAKMQGLSLDLLKAFNIDAAVDFTNIFDYLGYVIQYIGMASAVYGAILGVSALIREESQGTIEFLYSKPITRTKIVTAKLGSVFAMFCTYIVILCIFTTGMCYIVKPEDVDIIDLIINIKSVFMGISIVGVVFMSIGLLISAIIKSDKGAISIAIGIFFVSYFLGMVGKLKESFNWLKYFSPFDYFIPSEIMKNGLDFTYIIISLCVIIACISASYIIYRQKDMNI